MKTVLLALVATALAIPANAGTPQKDRSEAAFASVEAFAASMKSAHPAETQSGFLTLFAIPELGQPEDPERGKPVYATEIEACQVLWKDGDRALLFATAAPPTKATRSRVGVLFLLNHTGSGWCVADVRRFAAAGKEAGISAILTAGAGTGYSLGSEGMPPVVTVTESQGGRGYSRQTSASYLLGSFGLKRVEME